MSFLFTEVEINHYRFGYCHLFALALHCELGYKMEFFWESLPDLDNLNEDEPECLIHAYGVAPNGVKFDVQGLLSEQMIEETYRPLKKELIRIETEETLNKLMWGGILAIDNDGEIGIIRKHIRENIRKYIT